MSLTDLLDQMLIRETNLESYEAAAQQAITPMLQSPTKRHPKLKYVAQGERKVVFKVQTGEGPLAVAVYRLLGPDESEMEYANLILLHQKAPSLFPKPISRIYLPDVARGVLIMEFLKEQRLDTFAKEHPRLTQAYVKELGYSAGFVFERTGRFQHDPHSGNILAGCNRNKVRIKFIDVERFSEGDEDELFEYLSNPSADRSDVADHPIFFKNGFYTGVQRAKGL